MNQIRTSNRVKFHGLAESTVRRVARMTRPVPITRHGPAMPALLKWYHSGFDRRKDLSSNRLARRHMVLCAAGVFLRRQRFSTAAGGLAGSIANPRDLRCIMPTAGAPLPGGRWEMKCCPSDHLRNCGRHRVWPSHTALTLYFSIPGDPVSTS